MKPLSATTLVAMAAGLLTWSALLTAADKSTSIDFAGWVTAVNPAAKTIEVKARKTFVFTVDAKRCWIERNGNWWNQPGGQTGTLRLAKIGDAVIGKLSMAGPEPVVIRLDLMADPQFGLPVPRKPGFITSPYASSSRLPIDVHGLPRGAMVKDPSTGKIILVP